MKINKIERGSAIVTLYPEDCYVLANVCHEAEDLVGFFGNDEQLQIVRTMSSAFAALGVATEAHLHMRNDDIDDLAQAVYGKLYDKLFIPMKKDEVAEP